MSELYRHCPGKCSKNTFLVTKSNSAYRGRSPPTKYHQYNDGLDNLDTLTRKILEHFNISIDIEIRLHSDAVRIQRNCITVRQTMKEVNVTVLTKLHPHVRFVSPGVGSLTPRRLNFSGLKSRWSTSKHKTKEQ